MFHVVRIGCGTTFGDLSPAYLNVSIIPAGHKCCSIIVVMSHDAT